MISFSYPAFNPTATLQLDAQVLGDTDSPNVEIQTLYTMDGSILTRKKVYRAMISSLWEFRSVCNIEAVQTFFEEAEGEYLRYTHYNGSVWIIVITGKAFPARSDGLRTGNGLETYSFSLSVNRWPYA